MSVSLRKYPYPYQAALTICSNIDGTNFNNFIEIHKFLNTKLDTSLGIGLDLPIGDSFWMYDAPNITDNAFSYFKNFSGNHSDAAPIMRDLIKSGILDVMHSYGNFASIGDFSRELALKALEELDKNGLKVKVWTNHGGIESVQNIGRNSVGKGDIKSITNKFYHSDLLIDYGIKFFWDSKDAIATNVGQNCAAKFGDAYWRSPLYRGFNSYIKYSVKGIMTLGDKVLYKIANKHFIPWPAFDKNDNNLLTIDTLRDDTQIFKFKRFGLGYLDWSDNLSLLLNDKVLDRLIEVKGSSILYIHLGDRIKFKTDNLVLPKNTIKTLRKIAEFYYNGKIWLTTTSNLLKYDLLTKTIQYSVKETSRLTQIFINDISDKISKSSLIEDDLAGLTFFIPDNKKIELYFKNKPIKYQNNPIDNFGRSSISLPIHKLEWPL